MVGDRGFEHVRAAGHEVWTDSIRGRVRPENQDAWCVLTPQEVLWGPRHEPSRRSTSEGWGEGVAVGVFDGLGGHPNGRAAAQAAAQALPAVLAKDRSRRGVLAGLEEAVRVTGGATTAVVAFVETGEEHGRWRVVSVGDSTAYGLDLLDDVERVNPRDRRGRHELTDCLGIGSAEGHENHPISTRGLVLVTDGVDGVVPFEPWVRDLLTASSDAVARVIKRLWREIERAGAPDNATIVVLRPQG